MYMNAYTLQVGGHTKSSQLFGYAEFDLEDYEYYKQFKLQGVPPKHKRTRRNAPAKDSQVYVRAKIDGKIVVVARQILGLTDKFVQIRYIDGNSLNLRKDNLTTSLSDGVTKYCISCKFTKPIADYGTNRNSRDGLLTICKECAREQRWTPEHKEAHKYREIQRKYNLTREQYIAMLAEQSGHCMFCSRDTDLVVEHDHACCNGKFSCGKCVRGIACRYCNAVLGYSFESPELLRTIANYLQERQCRIREPNVT